MISSDKYIVCSVCYFYIAEFIIYLSNRIVVMAARPGRVVADIAVDSPYPRDEAFRTSTLYNDYCRTVSTALAEAMNQPSEAA